jgi:hypothetical protein
MGPDKLLHFSHPLRLVQYSEQDIRIQKLHPVSSTFALKLRSRLSLLRFIFPFRFSDQIFVSISQPKVKTLQATNFSYIKQYSNQSGLTEYNFGERLPLPT